MLDFDFDVPSLIFIGARLGIRVRRIGHTLSAGRRGGCPPGMPEPGCQCPFPPAGQPAHRLSEPGLGPGLHPDIRSSLIDSSRHPLLKLTSVGTEHNNICLPAATGQASQGRQAKTENIQMLRFPFSLGVALALLGVAAAYAPILGMRLQTSLPSRLSSMVLRKSFVSRCRAQASDNLTGAKFEEKV